MSCNFYFVKINKIALTQQPPKLEKNKHIYRILKIIEFEKFIFDLIEKQSNFT